MTAAVHRSTPSLSIPRTQNTAPVVEFNCLYTHDLRRKQKRWQDGFLRFHTFNKRVMVYDVPRNFLGDLHWTEGGTFQEGEELTLDKGGILVQVGEETGRTETDVSAITQRRDNKSSPAKPLSSPLVTRTTPRVQTPSIVRTTPRTQIAREDHQGKHVSLHSLLGPSRGHVGKAALPAKSPFEVRYKEQETEERERKRQKMDPWSVTRTTKTPQPGSSRSASSKMQKSTLARSRSSTKAPTAQRTLDVTEVIDISSDTEEPLIPDVAIPAPARISVPTTRALSPARSASVRGTSNRNTECDMETSGLQEQPPKASYGPDSPSIRTLQRKEIIIDRAMSLAAGQGMRDKPRIDDQPRQRSPPVSIGNKVSAGPTIPIGSPHFSESQIQGKALKLVGSAPRKMLISRGRTSNVSSPVESATKDQNETQPGQSIHHKLLQKRLDRINQRKRAQETEMSEIEGSTTLSTGLTGDTSQTPAAQGRQRTAVVRQVPEPGGQHRGSNASPSLLHPQAKDKTEPPKEPARVTASRTSDMGPPARPTHTTRKQSAAAKPAPTYNTRADGVATAMLAKPFRAPAPRSGPSTIDATGIAELRVKDAEAEAHRGPWSEEAFDLMDWRPPDRNADGSKKTVDGDVQG